MDGFDPETLADPIEELASTGKPDATFVLNGISNELQLATAIADNTDADLAVAIAGCLQENSECDVECQRCIAGLVARNLSQNSGIIDKTKNAIDRGVQNELSDAIQVATALGNPITDFVVVNGIPITTDGVPNDIPQSSPINIVASICPEGTTPQTTPDNRVECLDINQATVEPIQTVIQTGTNGGTISSGTTTSTSPDGSTEPKTTPAPVPPSSTPTTTPVTPTAPATTPTQPQPLPTETTVTHGPLPTGGQIDQTNCGTDEGTFRAQGYLPFDEWQRTHNISESLRQQMTDRFASVEFSKGNEQRVWISPVDQRGQIIAIGEDSCTSTYFDTAAQTPPQTVTTVTVTPTPQVTHPFCDPDHLKTNDIGVTAREPSATLSNTRLVTLGSDLSTIAYQPTGNDALDALTGIFASPIVAAGYGIDFVVNGVSTILGGVGGTLVDGLSTIVGGLATLAGPMLSSGPCQDKPFTTLAIANFVPSLLQFFGGCIPTQITIPNTYAMNYLCPVLIPSGPDMNNLRSRGLLTESQWRIGVRANNLCPEWQQKIVDSMRTIPTPDQVQLAWRRGIIDDDAYDYYMERNGILREEDANVFFKLTEFVPGPSDLVRFMVRDVFDDDVVTSQQLDSEFEKKFQGRAREWAADQGMSEDQFRFYWRSHWQYPSPGQLYQMLHRLRSDQELPSGLGTAKAVKAEDVLLALAINDQSPEWTRRLVAISYSPLTRVDSRRAYEVGELSADKLEEAYLNLGYSPENAKILRQFSETTSAPVRAKRLGNASTQEVIKWYQQNLIPRDQAEELLTSSGIKRELASKFLETASLRRTLSLRMDSLKALRKRFMTGEFSPGEIAAELIDAGISPDSIGDMIESWANVRDAKYKAPTVGMLCDWWSRGFITMDQFQRRCQNLGYSLVDAERIVAACQGKLAERKEKEAEKLAKEAEAKQRRIESDRRRMVSDQKKLEKEIKAALAEAATCKPPPKPTCETNGTPSPTGP